MEKDRKNNKYDNVNAEIEEKEFCLNRLTPGHTLSYNDSVKTANNIFILF